MTQKSKKQVYFEREDGLSDPSCTAGRDRPAGCQVDLIKLLWWDGDGCCLFAKRLGRGRFIWQQATEGSIHLTGAQLSMRLEDIDWRRPERTWKPKKSA